MDSSIQNHILYLSLAAAGLVFLSGLLTQLFIVVVNITDWMKGRPKTPVDQILTSLGITRIFLLSFTFLDSVLFTFLESKMGFNFNKFIKLIGTCSNLSDIWLGSLFSVIFCMKICNFLNAFFLYLKRLISRRVVHLIVGLVLFSICYVALCEITDHIIMSNLLQNSTSNETQIPQIIHIYIFISIETSIPFLIYSTSSLLLIVSLCLHMNRMKSNSYVSTNLDSYYKAIRFMILCLIGFMLRIGSNAVVLYYFHSWDIVWFFIICNSVPILDSMYLIYRTNKLSNRFSKILDGMNSMFHRKYSVSNCADEEETTTTS